MITAVALIESINSRIPAFESSDLAVFWFQVSSERERFKAELIRSRNSMTLVPLVIRDGGFNAPNAILSDLSKIIVANEAEFPLDFSTSPTVVVLLSKTTLQVPQLSSPITLPSWVPNCGGRTVMAIIEDLTHTADALINASDIQIESINQQLWRLEQVFVERLERANSRDHRQTNALLDYFRRSDSKITVEGLISESRQYRQRFDAPSAFRPSVRDSACFVSRLVGLVSQSSPDELSKRCKWISDAIDCPSAGVLPNDALISVLLRPTQKVPDNGTRVIRNAVLTVYSAYQLANATAHAGEYGRYPIVLLRGISYDIRNALSKIAEFLEIGDGESPL